MNNISKDHKFHQNLVSVIIPTYNRYNFLAEAIRSVFEQTYRPIECIIIDDGSTDNTMDVVTEVQSLNDDDFTLIYLFQQNSGSQFARNTGTEMAKGQYIQYLDSDDLLYPNKLKEQVGYLQYHPECDAVFGDWESGTTDSRGFIKGYVSEDLIKQMLTLERSIANFSILMRKKLVERIGAWDISLKRCQEIDFHLRGLMVGADYHHLSGITGLWRYHENERIHNQAGVYAIAHFYRKWEEILTEKELFTSEMAYKIADWYIWFLTKSMPLRHEKSLNILRDAVRLNPSILFYNSIRMRLLRLLFGKEYALKIWLKLNLKTT